MSDEQVVIAVLIGLGVALLLALVVVVTLRGNLERALEDLENGGTP